ncbi:hypothetical protein [Streptomyces luteireticuli]|uniref:Albusnodin family lasso peptide n=1 Tax=Streptomyces luteireticuli TaxID=173858 RepID=A0ABN0YK33_9ACTN
MTQHTHLTPDLPPVVEVPDLPGASKEDAAASDAAAGQGCGAHHEGDGRHGCATGGSGG